MHGLASFVFVDDLLETKSKLLVLLNNMKTHPVQSTVIKFAMVTNKELFKYIHLSISYDRS